MVTLSRKGAPSRPDSRIDDLELYRALTQRLGAPPTAHMMRHAGPQGRRLAELADDITRWKRFTAQAAARWPDLPLPGALASDGTRLDSAPERICYETLRPLVRPPLTLVLHPRLFPDRSMAADFGLAGGDGVCHIHVEVTGMFGSDLVVRTPSEVQSLTRLQEKQRLQAEAGQPPLRIVFLDVLAHPDWLRASCEEAVQAALSMIVREGGAA